MDDRDKQGGDPPELWEISMKYHEDVTEILDRYKTQSHKYWYESAKEILNKMVNEIIG